MGRHHDLRGKRQGLALALPLVQHSLASSAGGGGPIGGTIGPVRSELL